MKIMSVITKLRSLGWSVEERPAHTLQLPPEVLVRYPQLPLALMEFLSRITSCINPSETAWFLCEADFYSTSESAFRWNEWELISLEAADGDNELLSNVRSFWDNHFPFFLSVTNGYSYYAVETSSKNSGRIVKGHEPEFEEITVVAESFEQFLSQLCAA